MSASGCGVPAIDALVQLARFSIQADSTTLCGVVQSVERGMVSSSWVEDSSGSDEEGGLVSLGG